MFSTNYVNLIGSLISLSLSLISVKIDSGHLRWSICENLPNVPARVILTEVGQISFQNLLISAVPCFAYYLNFRWFIFYLNSGNSDQSDVLDYYHFRTFYVFVKMELVQAGGETMTDVLTEICNGIWKTEEWTTPWTQSLIITLPKKGNLQLCQNYRTICLISHSSKAMLKVILNRLKPKLKK